MPIGRKKKALIHIAKADLHLEDESYRQILKGVAGVESAAELTREGFDKVMKRFQELGFKGLLPSPFHPVPKGRLIPLQSPQGFESDFSEPTEFHRLSPRKTRLGRTDITMPFLSTDH